jgi:tRNA A37 threonylcarbamoyladenosine dehydratase
VPAVYSLENVKYPQPDGSVCGLRPELGPDAALKLDCGVGLGAATHVTGTFAFAAAGKALEVLLKPRAG